MALSKQAILKHAGVFETKRVHIPRWRDESGDDEVIVRSMTIREYEIHQARIDRELAAADGQESGEASARLLVRCIVDENNARVFTDDDVAQVRELGLGEINKLMQAVNDMSGLGDNPEKQAEIDKAAAGESEAQTSSSS